MELLSVILKGVGILFLMLLAVDFVWGEWWASQARRLFKKLAEVMLNGAVMDLYHERVSAILRVLDRRIGCFVPRLRIFLFMFGIFVGIYVLTVFVQAIQESKPFAPTFWRHLFLFCSGSSISASLCYCMTYVVLHTVNNRLGAFLPRYIHLVSIELVVSYILAPMGYAALFLPDLRMFSAVSFSWPASVTMISYQSIYNFQSATSAVLLSGSMVLCVAPTVLHIGMLVVDALRYVAKYLCERLMDTFDDLASRSAPMRRVLISGLSIISSVGWLLG